ncbi:MAG TPA: PEP/pyruvate-binding domain-containing protein [Steroidobacteraceae bacterium]|nr:PEP/pyruvate-binding domain-containing protein [Steroidobacteraceae bacterium]
MDGARERLFFIPPDATAPPADVNVVGSKAFGLLRVAQRGLRVPPAFVLGTDLCRAYFEGGERLPEEVRGMLETGLARLAERTGQRFGDTRRPLLVAVRSGAAVSMPGMLDTLLNIGLSEHNLHGLLRSTGNPRLTRDCYRRLVRDFTSIVHGVSAAPFDALVERRCREQGLGSAGELDSASLAELCAQSLETALAVSGQPFPQAPMEQLEQAVAAVLRSWNSDKARHYRRLNGIDELLGTAVTVQAMVFGNGGSTSGAGVGFTRDPASGENALYVDFLFNSQGEDVVSGRHPVENSARLERTLPEVARELERLKGLLEDEFHDMQDFEFTVADGRLYLLQTRAGKRTPWAALRIAVDLVREGRLTQAQALDLLRSYELERIERARLDAQAGAEPLAVAVPASIGVAAGAVVFDCARAVERAARGESVILARPDIATADVEGIAAAAGILTASGGRTSHAAVVARQLGKVCLVGCSQLRIEDNGRGCHFGGQRLEEGEPITLDGDSGRVYRGRLHIVREQPERELAEIRSWRTPGAPLEPTRASSGRARPN